MLFFLFLISIQRVRKSGKVARSLAYPNGSNGMDFLISLGDAVCRYCETKKSEKPPVSLVCLLEIKYGPSVFHFQPRLERLSVFRDKPCQFAGFPLLQKFPRRADGDDTFANRAADTELAPFLIGKASIAIPPFDHLAAA